MSDEISVEPTRSGEEATTGVDALMLLGAAGVGAALMYVLDPARGARRRKAIVDHLVHARHVAADAAGTTGRDLSNRARGLAAISRRRLSGDDADDRVIEERVRAELGRVVSHPGAIVVAADEGHVILSGAVLAHEEDAAVRRIRRVRGVRGVENRLQTYETADQVPSLQGGAPRGGGEFELRQENWSPAARFLTAVGGGALALYGARRRDAFGTVLGAGGLALLARGTTNTDLGRLVGAGRGPRGVAVQKTINIAAPVERVSEWVTDWEHFPNWMSHVREVSASGLRGVVGERTHWVVDGPAGIPVAWDAEITRFVPNRLVAWRSIAGSPVAHAGTLQLTPNADGTTRLHVQMTYNPPAGAIGHAVAAFFGRDPKHQMDDDLARLKTTIETGRPPHDASRPGGVAEAAGAGATLGPGTA